MARWARSTFPIIHTFVRQFQHCRSALGCCSTCAIGGSKRREWIGQPRDLSIGYVCETVHLRRRPDPREQSERRLWRRSCFQTGPVVRGSCSSRWRKFSPSSAKITLETIYNRLVSHHFPPTPVPWRALKCPLAFPRAGQRFVTRHARQFFPGPLGGDSASVHCADEGVAGTNTPQADRQDVQLPLERYFVSASGPPNECAPAHCDVLRERSLPGLAVSRARHPHE